MLARIFRSLSLILLGGLLTWAAVSWLDGPPHSPDARTERPSADSGDDDIPSPSAPEKVANDVAPSLVLSRERQQQAGIITALLAASQRSPELAASALVVDLQPLLDLHAQAQTLQAERPAAQAGAETSGRSLQRLTQLRQQAAASPRQWQEANAQAAASQSRLAATESRWRALHTEARQQWGETLSLWALDQPDSTFERLSSGHERLLLVTLPPEHGFSGNPPVSIHAGRGDRTEAREARLISAAPRSDALLQGETFFYTLPAAGLRTGMRLEAWLPLGDAAETGVDAPREAVVWRAGQPWLYVRTAPERFERRAVGRYRDLGAIWFITSGVQPGETAVTRGAQLLLSEEFRQQTPGKDDD